VFILHSRGDMISSSSETQALLSSTSEGREKKSSSSSSSSIKSSLKAATAIVAVSTSIFATASYSVSRAPSARGASQSEHGLDVFKRAIASLGDDAIAPVAGANDKVTLTVGCSHKDVLKRLPFDPEGWDSKVGAKLITESKSKTFAFEDAIEMKEVGCGKFQTPYKLGSGAKFGFYLYEKANPENYVSDIGGKLLFHEEMEEEAAIGEGETEAASTTSKKKSSSSSSSSSSVSSATSTTETASTDYAAQAAAAEQNANERAKEITALLSASIGKKKHGSNSAKSAKSVKKQVEEEIEEEVSEEGEVEENTSSSKKHSYSVKKTVKGSKKSDPAAVASEELESSGIQVVGEYFDWGWWMSALSQGTQYQTTDITCENTTCTMQVCEKTKCTEYKKECETTEMCDDLGDFVKEQTASMGKSGITKKQAAKALDEATKASSEVSEFQIQSTSSSSKKSHHRHLLSHHHHHATEEVSEEEVKPTHGKAHEHKHFAGFGSDALQEDETSEEGELDEELEEAQEEFEEEEEEEVPSKSKKTSSKKSSKKSSSSKHHSKHHEEDSIADTGANEFDVRHPAHIASRMSGCTTQHVAENMEFYPRVHGPANANHVYIFGGCYADRDHATCNIPIDVNPKQCVIVRLNDNNFQEAVNACLDEAPVDGKCVNYGKESKYGILPRWDVTQVHNMQRAFADTEFNGYLGSWDTSNVRNMNQMFANNKAFNGDIRKWSFEHLGSATGIFDGADKYNAKWECGFKATGIIDFSSCQSSETLKKQKEIEEKMQRSHFVANPEYNPEQNTVQEDTEPQSSATAFDDENAEKYAAEREQDFNAQVEEANEEEESSGGFFNKLFGGGSSSSAAPKEEHEEPTAAAAATTTTTTTTTVSDDGDYESSNEQQQQLPEELEDDAISLASSEVDEDRASSVSSSSSSSSSSSTNTFTEKELTDANFKQQVALCLAEEPKKGDCMDNEFGPMISWDTSKVTNMYEAFANPPTPVEGDKASTFNGDLSKWDTSQVTNMRRMFSNARHFEGGDLSKWDTSRVQDMSQMFSGANSFDGDISSWDTSRCEDMHQMFEDARQFNQDIGKWQVGKALKMSSMFHKAESFDQDLRKWSVAKVADQEDIFKGASAFNEKFECASKHSGPVMSCKDKSEKENGNSNVLSKIFG
jgi:surface protein